MLSKIKALKSMLAVLCLLPASCFAQRDRVPLSLRLEPFSTSPRSYSPLLVEATLDPLGTQLLEGTLHLRFAEGSTKLLEVRIPDLVISGSPYVTTLVLPPMPTASNKVINVNAKFVMADGEFPLGAPAENSTESYLSLLVPPSSQRSLLMGMVVEGKDDPKTANLSFLSKFLSLEEHAEQFMTWGGDNKLEPVKYGRFASSAAIMNPEVLPADPLSLCAFDIVIVADGGLPRLDQKQLDGLRGWVQAGGSLCVVPDGKLSVAHTGFLSGLLAEYPDPPAMVLDDSGMLSNVIESPAMAPLGLGRVVILPPDGMLSDAMDEAMSREVAGFLWKIRAFQQAREKWETSSPEAFKAAANAGEVDPWTQAYQERDYQMGLESATVSPVGVDQVIKQLMPSNVRMVPLWLVAAMLVSYVFAVGPGDYLLLGVLKMRRYTWVAFPIITALFTFGMVGVSNYYMGTSETGGQIEINDLVGSGQVVRRTGIDLEFFGSRQELHEDRANEFITQMDLRAAMYEYQNQNGMYSVDAYGNPVSSQPQLRQQAEFSGDTTGLYYEGRVPARFATHRIVRQWEPQLKRTLSIVSETAPDCGFDWADPGPLWTMTGRTELAAAIAKHDSSAGAILMNAGEIHALRPLPYSQAQQLRRNQYNYDGYGQVRVEDYFTLLRQVSARSKHYFRYVSRISPNGANNFEDLAMLDSSDPDQWLLIVSWLEGDTQKVFRRLYHRPFGGQSNDSQESAE